MKATRKDLVNFCKLKGKALVSGGYCEFQDVTDLGTPLFQNFGLYGWNWTAYEFETCVICTGYRNTVGTRLKNSSEFNDMIHKVRYDRNVTYEEKREKILEMLKKHVSDSNIRTGYTI